MKKAIAMAIIRLGDIVTTTVVICRYGVDVEGNPVARYLMGRSYLGYMLMASGISLLLSIAVFKAKEKPVQIAFSIFMIINALVVCTNFFCCFI